METCDDVIVVMYRKCKGDRFEQVDLTIGMDRFRGSFSKGIKRHVELTEEAGDYLVLVGRTGYLYHVTLERPTPPVAVVRA